MPSKSKKAEIKKPAVAAVKKASKNATTKKKAAAKKGSKAATKKEVFKGYKANGEAYNPKAPIPDATKPHRQAKRRVPTEPSPYLKPPPNKLPAWRENERPRLLVINLDRHPDKWQKYQDQNDSGLYPWKYERFSGCDGIKERATNKSQKKYCKILILILIYKRSNQN